MSGRVFRVLVRHSAGDVLVVDDQRSKSAADASAERYRRDRRPGEVVEIVEHDVAFISRAAAAQKIRSHWLETYTREQLLAAYEPEWSRLRNYEIESMLERTFDGIWCVNEWCPFNGEYCRWAGHVGAVPQSSEE